MLKIEVHEPWRPGGSDSQGRTLMLHCGVYVVPRDLPEDMAHRAIKAGVATIIPPKVQPLPTVPDPVPVEAPAAPSKRGRGRSALEIVSRRWAGRTVVVAASGPSLTPEVAERCKGFPTIAVNDAYRMLPWADVLYACDADWWAVHEGCPDFAGEKWSSHGTRSHDNKLPTAQKYGLCLIAGKDRPGFSLDQSTIHYGWNSGFQATNLAILFGARRIVLVGFDMRAVEGKRHFFGDHLAPLRNTSTFASFIKAFEDAPAPDGVEIINATPNSALTCYGSADLVDALSDTV